MATQPKSRYTQAGAQKALAAHRYTKADGKTGYLSLTGAHKRWATPGHEQDVYLPGYRLAGSPLAVQTALTAAGLAPAQAQQALAAGYTAQSVQGPLRAQFEQEVQAAQLFKKAQPKKGKGAKVQGPTLAQLGAILAQGGAAPAKRPRAGAKGKAKPRAPRAPRAAAPAGGARGGAKVPLTQRLAALPQGKVLDVSKMSATGAGVKTVAKPTERSKKLMVPGLNIVSDNEATFLQALQELGPQYQGYADQYRQLVAGRRVPSPGRAPPVGGVPIFQPPVQAQYAAAVQPRVASPPRRPPSPRAAVPPVMPQIQPRPPSPRGIVAPVAGVPPRQPTPPRAAMPAFPGGALPALPRLGQAGGVGMPNLPPLPPLGGAPGFQLGAPGALGRALSPGARR